MQTELSQILHSVGPPVIHGELLYQFWYVRQPKNVKELFSLVPG